MIYFKELSENNWSKFIAPDLVDSTVLIRYLGLASIDGFFFVILFGFQVFNYGVFYGLLFLVHCGEEGFDVGYCFTF